VHPRLEQLRHRPPRPRRGPVEPVTRPERTSTPAAPDEAERPLRDRGITLLAIFTGAALFIVALVCLVAGVDRWWILIPVMAADLMVTAAVLAVMIRLLDDGSGT
jgi:hypothetical protein